MLHQIRLRSAAVLTKATYGINTDLIKKQYEEKFIKHKKIAAYPKTFEDKAKFLNDSKNIEIISIEEFGVKYKKGNKLIPIVLLALAGALYWVGSAVPKRVEDRYFMVSVDSPTYMGGYFFAAFNFEKPFYLYLPLQLGILHVSKFISLSNVLTLISVNMIVGACLSQYLVNERVSQYEVWESERLCFGEGTSLSLLYAFWSALGFTNGFTSLRSKVLLKSIPGIGIVRAGFPIAHICLIYTAIELLYYYAQQSKNSEVVFTNIACGTLYGLLIRRFKPIGKPPK